MAESKAGNYSVYILESPEGKKYVGCTALYPWMRWNKGSGYRMNKELWADIQKFGWDNFKRTIVKSGMCVDEAAQMEVDLIADLRTRNPRNGYNKTVGGDHLKEKTKNIEFTDDFFLMSEELSKEFDIEEMSKLYDSLCAKIEQRKRL